jgi:regulator of RNase E activity RraB
MLTRIKLKLSITDNNQDALLTMLLEDASNLICLYVTQETLPAKLAWIAEEIAIKRFRKIGSEGLKAESIDVIKNDFEDAPLSEYSSILNEYKASNKKRLRTL